MGKRFEELGFKAGDRVRCTSGNSAYKTGDEFVLQERPCTLKPRLYLNNSWYDGSFGKWEKAVDFKVGDKVRVKPEENSVWATFGVGEVVTVHADDFVSANFAEGGIGAFKTRGLVLVEEDRPMADGFVYRNPGQWEFWFTESEDNIPSNATEVYSLRHRLQQVEETVTTTKKVWK